MIEVGEYVRTKKKGIFKVLSIRKTPYGHYCGTVDSDNIRTFTIGKGGNAEIKNDIVKHSKNIIDLIEVGDYVNGKRVGALKGDVDWSDVASEEDVVYTEYNDDWGEWFGFEKDEIKTIVTHEQFESIEYRLEDTNV